MSDTAKEILLTKDERTLLEMALYQGKYDEEVDGHAYDEGEYIGSLMFAIAKAQLLKAADWIEKQEEDNTHLHIGNLVSKLREAAETDVL